MALTAEENERLTRVGPGTPMGDLLRWYWHPVAATAQLLENPVRRVRILGEDLVLYRDRSGRLGLVGDRCAHRSTGLQYGIPDEDGLRCPYHGWKYDATGQCTDQPLEPPGSTFKERIKITAYPVQEMGGLIWAYLGEPPVPLLPRWDQFVRPNTFRHIAGTMLPCNWLQCLENGGDPNHGTYLHGHFYRYALERMRAEGRPVKEEAVEFLGKDGTWCRRPPTGMGPSPTRCATSIARSGRKDTSTARGSIWSTCGRSGAAPRRSGLSTRSWSSPIAYFEPPWRFESGEPNFSYITAQDELGWRSQGEITDRTTEHLGYSDTAIIAFRQILAEQLDIVEKGGQPMNVFWDPEENESIPMVPGGRERRGGGGGQARHPIDTAQFSPVWDQLWDLYQRDQAVRAARLPGSEGRELLDRIVECGCCVPMR